MVDGSLHAVKLAGGGIVSRVFLLQLVDSSRRRVDSRVILPHASDQALWPSVEGQQDLVVGSLAAHGAQHRHQQGLCQRGVDEVAVAGGPGGPEVLVAHCEEQDVPVDEALVHFEGGVPGLGGQRQILDRLEDDVAVIVFADKGDGEEDLETEVGRERTLDFDGARDGREKRENRSHDGQNGTHIVNAIGQ